MFAGCESFLESHFLQIFALCEKNLDDSADSSNLSMRSFYNSIKKSLIKTVFRGFIQAILMSVIWHKKLYLTTEF